MRTPGMLFIQKAYGRGLPGGVAKNERAVSCRDRPEKQDEDDGRDQATGRIQPPSSRRAARRLTGRPTTVDQEPCTLSTRKAPCPWMA